MDAKIGDTATCAGCGRDIVFIGPYWDHAGGIDPHHPAMPTVAGVPPAAPLQPEWRTWLDPRERAQVEHALHYAANFTSAGAPGHGQFLLIAKLAAALDEATRDA